MKNAIIFLSLAFIPLLTGCGSEKIAKKTCQTYTVKIEPTHQSLYFTGIIQPLHESTLTSPVDGIVETMYYHYGQFIKKGDVIFTLNSSELQKQYNETFTDYLKAKDSFSVAKAKFAGTTELWNAGLLSKNNFLSEKSSLDTARISYLQATYKLTQMLEKMDNGKKHNLSALNIAEFEKIRLELTTNHNLLHIKAPHDGMLLYPPKSTENKDGKIRVGSALKAGQVLALVGDLSGISIEIDVSEIDIGKIYSGMKANITGVALGKQRLAGEVVAVNAQASASNTGLPSFNAMVEVKNLNDNQRARIKVGMSAAIEIAVNNNEQLLIPIAAVKQEKGNSVVKLQSTNGKLHSQVITTGPAQADKVVVASGLQVGDVIAYD